MIKLEHDNNYNIVLIGVGGTGSHLISFLCQLIGNNKAFKTRHKIILVDGDKVEEKNLKTQKFLSSDVGLFKSEVLADRYSAVFGLDISYKDSYIESKHDVLNLLNGFGHNIIISCVDNNKARKLIDEAVNEYPTHYSNTSLICIDTGNSSGSGDLTGQTVVAYKNMEGTLLPSASTYFPQMLEEETEEPTAGCGEVMLENIQNIGANITSACTVFNILNNIISFNQIPGDLFMFNATKIETESMKANIE